MQDLIVLFILALTVIYTGYSIKKSLKVKAKSKCDGCTGCDAKVMFEAAALKKKSGCH